MYTRTHRHTNEQTNKQNKKTNREEIQATKKSFFLFFSFFFFGGGGVSHSLPETTDPAQRQGTSELQTKISVLLNEIKFWKQ